MRTQIEVTDLTGRQWDWLQDNLMTGYDFTGSDVRVCVAFILNEGKDERHVEMPVVAFAGLQTVLLALEMQGTPLSAWGGPVKDAELMRCLHGEPVIRQDPSGFRNGQPVRTFADGCQEYGPHSDPEVQTPELPGETDGWV